VGAPYIEGIVFRTEGIVEAKSARIMGPARGAEPDGAEDWLGFGRLRHGFSTDLGLGHERTCRPAWACPTRNLSVTPF
jgi:hypothetical protein